MKAPLLIGALAAAALFVVPAVVGAQQSPSDDPPLHERYRDAASRIIGAALLSNDAYDTLAVLCDRFGHRLSGSARLDAAITWAHERLRADGFANVRAEVVMVPAWVRGEERARLVQPADQSLTILGLGGSVGTPSGGLDAEVVVVSDFDELEALGADKVRGKVVLYDVPFTSYGETVRYRAAGPSRAAKLGAVATLVRSVGPVSLSTPHTGMLSYEEGVPKIPAAAVTIENSTMMRRMSKRGETIRIHLEMGAHQLDDARSANLVAEVTGSELPDEVVVLGGHFDSWDVGQGAQDDGVGSMIAWKAARLIKDLGLRPRRTIRVVLFTNEENGLRGAKAYAEHHAKELPKHVAAIESDLGNGLARGFTFELPPSSPPPAETPKAPTSPEAKAKAEREKKRTDALDKARSDALTPKPLAILNDIARLLEPLGSTKMSLGHSGADVGQSVAHGVAGLGLDHDPARYFDIHHTPADTFDKIDKGDLNTNVATMAVMAYVLADMPGRLLDASVVQAHDTHDRPPRRRSGKALGR